MSPASPTSEKLQDRGAAPGNIAAAAAVLANADALLIKLFSISRRIVCWVDAVADAVALVMIGVLLRQQHTNLFAVRIPPALFSWLHITLTVTLLFVALVVAIDLVANLARLGRKRLAK